MMLEKDPFNFSTMQTKMPKGGMRSRLCGIKIHHRLFSIVNILCNVKHAHCRLSKCNGTLVSPCSIPPDTQCGIHQDSCSVNRLCCVVSRIAFSMDVPLDFIAKFPLFKVLCVFSWEENYWSYDVALWL